MYKLKDGVELPKEFKIKVNPEQSKALQLHLFSIGYKWMNDENEVMLTEADFLYLEYGKICHTLRDRNWFSLHPNERIKFKDYFEKVTNQFPEKWCILVTEENYKELNVYLHRNWKNYEGYIDKWKVTPIHTKVFYSHGKDVWNKGHKDVFYELITTEQFRKQFGIVKINETEIKEIEHNLDFWHERAIHYKQRCKDLRLERYEMSKEIKSLKITIEAIKELISDNPIIKD